MSSTSDTIFVDDDSDKAVETVDENDEEEVQFVHERGNGTENRIEEGESTIEELEKKLMNTIVDSLGKAYQLYCEYAHVCGFSVRKGKQYYVQGTKDIRSKVFYCSKQGVKKYENEGCSSYEKLETRTACKAMVQFEVDKDGNWKVNKIQKDHNHEMAKAYEKHLLRSARRVSQAQGDTLESLISVGIKTSQAFSYMTKESGGVGGVGFLKKDAYNEINNRRNSMIEKGDAQSLVNHFKHRSSREGMFFWDVELDDDGRIHNFFWRDGRSQIDYDFFGDVVVFDATYRTNKYNLICAPFIGVNHHWQTIIFACAFLSDESATSFKWAFRSFLESMDNKQPVTFMTDQDYAIMKAANIVFPDSQHRLCLWHICKNAPSYFGCLNNVSGFQQLFHKCLTGCETKEEFEETWAKMICDYNLEGHKWLAKLYNLRDRWCTALTNDTFSAGFKTTSRSESTNSVLNGIGSKTTSLTKFVVEFERKVGEWRQNEAESDFLCKHGKPPLAVKNSAFLRQAAHFYTHKLYKLFEKEFMGILASSHEEENCGESIYRFHVTLDSKWGPKTSTVILNTREGVVVHCSCKKFETVGILCTHALAALRAKSVTKIPDACLLKRWGKDARKRVSDMEQAKIFNMEGTSSDICYTNRSMKFAYDLIYRSQSNEATRLMVWQGLESISANVDDYFKKHSLIDTQSGIRAANYKIGGLSEEGNASDISVQDPNKIRSKGRERGERLKGHFERRRKIGSSKKSDSSQGKRKNAPSDEGQVVCDDVSQECVGLNDPNLQLNMATMTMPMTTFPTMTWNYEGASLGGSYQSFTSMLQGYSSLNSKGGDDSCDAEGENGDHFDE